MKSTFIRITLIYFLFVLFIPNLTFAETKTFIKEYTYQASEDDSMNKSRINALREVKRLLLEELGTYLESETEVKNFHLTKDQITTLTAGIVNTEIVDQKWDGKNYWLRVRISADPESVIKAIDILRKDHEKSKELEETRKNAEGLAKENEQLRKTIGEKGRNETKINKKLKCDYGASAEQIYFCGYLLTFAEIDFEKHITKPIPDENYKDAIEYYNIAIEMAPGYLVAYVARAEAYLKLHNYQQAIKDCNRAIELSPSFAEAYVMRGNVYIELRNYCQAIMDFDEAIALKPNLSCGVYEDRGNAYKNIGDITKATKNWKKAAQSGCYWAQVELRRREIDW